MSAPSVSILEREAETITNMVAGEAVEGRAINPETIKAITEAIIAIFNTVVQACGFAKAREAMQSPKMRERVFLKRKVAEYTEGDLRRYRDKIHKAMLVRGASLPAGDCDLLVKEASDDSNLLI